MLRCLIALLSLFAAHLAAAQSYPSKPVRIVVAFAPGGGDDFHGRLMAQKLSEALGQQFVVENRSGAGGYVGWEFISRSAPDGLLKSGSDPATSTPAELAALLRENVGKFGKIIKSAGIKAE